MELVIVAALIVANGFLAMSELALVSAKNPRLERMQRNGSRGAGIALALTRDPGRMLSPVQIGIILVGIDAGAFGGVTIAERGDAWLESLGMRRALRAHRRARGATDADAGDQSVDNLAYHRRLRLAARAWLEHERSQLLPARS